MKQPREAHAVVSANIRAYDSTLPGTRRRPRPYLEFIVKVHIKLATFLGSGSARGYSAMIHTKDVKSG